MTNLYKKQTYISFIFMTIVLLLFLILKSEICTNGARSGLLLWAYDLLPVLLPFCILSKLLLQSHAIDLIAQKLRLPLWLFVLFFGIFCGFPMGAILAKDLYESGRLRDRQAFGLFLFANHLSPAFVSGYLLTQKLHRPDLFLPSICLLYAPPVICCITYELYDRQCMHFPRRLNRDEINLSLSNGRQIHPHQCVYFPRRLNKKTTSRLQINFEIIDAVIMNSLEIMLKLGVYLTLFAILTNLCMNCPFPIGPFKQFSAYTLETTNAIHLICLSAQSNSQKYALCLAATAFGGFCGLAQTLSVTAKYRQVFRIIPYILVHSVHALLTYFLVSLVC